MQKNLFQDDGCEIDVTLPFIRVVAYKDTGKWYASQYTLLDPAHLEIINSNKGWEIDDLFRLRHESVKKYLPVTGWNFIFTIEVFNCEGFCHRLIDLTL